MARWVVRYGHQVSGKNAGRKIRRHIPNPNVSVGNLEQAGAMWVGKWDEEDEEDDGGREDEVDEGRQQQKGEMEPAFGSNTPTGHSHGGMPPMGVLPEEDGAFSPTS